MQRYKIITGNNPRELENLIEEHMKYGWTPLGGVGFCAGGAGYFEKWYQSLTR